MVWVSIMALCTVFPLLLDRVVWLHILWLALKSPLPTIIMFSLLINEMISSFEQSPCGQYAEMMKIV